MTYEIGIDVSKWRPKIVKSAVEGHVTFISAKAVEIDDQIYGWNSKMSPDIFIDPTFATHCQTAHDIGAQFVPFIFGNTRYKSEWYASSFADHTRHPNGEDPEIVALRQALENKEYTGFAIDAERWWFFYNQYLSMLAGKLPGDQVQKIASLWIRDSTEDLYIRVKEEMRVGNFRDVPIWMYFGKYFIDGYSPELDTFLADKIQWMTKYNGPVYDASLKTSKVHIDEWEELDAIVRANVFTTPWVGNRPCNVLQLTDKYFLPGIQDTLGKPLAVDVDITVSDWSMLFAGSPVPPVDVPIVIPPIVIPPVVVPVVTIKTVKTKQPVRLRLKPNTSSDNTPLVLLPSGIKFEVIDTKTIGTDTWRKVAAWVADDVAGTKYLNAPVDEVV